MYETRDRVGKKATTIAIVSNCFLTIINIWIGLMSGSYALVAEGAHTLSDVFTSIVAFIGFKIGQKPADTEHQLGHGRAEAICGLLIVLFLAIVGYQVIVTALEKFLNPNLITVPDIYAALVAIFGILMNLIISTYIIKIGNEINSPAIVADGYHQRTDIFSSIAILIGVVVANTGFKIVDPIVGMIIGVLILRTSYAIGKENIDYIMGKNTDDTAVRKIIRIVNRTPGVYGAHNIKVDNYGSYLVVNLHVKVNGNTTVEEADSLVANVESIILNKIPEIKYVYAYACPSNKKCNSGKKSVE